MITRAMARKRRKIVVRQISIPTWADPLWQSIRRSICVYVDRVDKTYEDAASKRAACRVRAVNIITSNTPETTISAPIYELLGKSREGILAEMDAILRDRGDYYGDPKINFTRAAAIQKVINDCPDDVCKHVLSALSVKMARLVATPNHEDSWLDIANYAVIALALVREAKNRGV